MITRQSLTLFLVLLLSLGAAAPRAWPATLEFPEIWAWLIDGEEKFYDPAMPLSDIGYFGAGINSQGRLSGLPKREKLAAFPGRVHLVIAELGNYALIHFCLDPSLPLRDLLVADIVQAAKVYDGVQIDFEAVSAKDYDNFYEFLRLLKLGLGDKILGVDLPACTKAEADRFGYDKVGALADRVFIMAYDEHWSGGEAGPVSSLAWGEKVATYALSKLPPSKLVMGSPFYGRAWADKTLSRAYKYTSLSSLLAEKGEVTIQRKDGIPYAEYVETVNVKVFFDDASSVLARLGAWKTGSVRNIAFWRLGQEDPVIWTSLGLERPAPPPAGVPSQAPVSPPALP
jgi:hypothetical protein